LPNPAKNEIKIVSENQIQSVDIYDLTGRLMLRNELLSSHTLNISGLVQGVYFVHSKSTDSEKFINKIIVN
jgi:hypothetical protein